MQFYTKTPRKLYAKESRITDIDDGLQKYVPYLQKQMIS